MKTILILTNHSYMLWQFRRELIAELLRQHSVVIGTPFGDRIDDFEKMGCRMIDTPVDRRGINPLTDLGLLRRYFSILKDVRPDMVITYSIKPNVYGGFACARMGIPYCVNVQGLGTAFQREPIASIASALYRMGTRRAKTLFFENEGNAEEFRRRGIAERERQTILRGAGVNLSHYAAQPYVKKDAVHFLYLGRIMREKGMDELFSAYSRLHSRYGKTVMLDLAGFFEDEYKARVQQMQEAGAVTFHGFQADPRALYAQADCVVLPSWHEGMSNVLLEAAATGRLLITSDIPGCREAVEDGVSGLLCRVKDADSLYEQMEQAARMTPAERERMGKAGRKRMEQLFDKTGVVKRTVEAIFAE